MAYRYKKKWKEEFQGRTALLIKGARRVGKSTLVEEFAKNEYESYILIDFSIASKEVNTLFTDLSDLNYLFLRLQMIYHVNLVKRKSVIIFDEVQMQPLTRQAIKHFRLALGDAVTVSLLRNAYENMTSLGDDINRRMFRDFRLYMLVGGIPQAVDAYISTNNLGVVDQIKRNILELYEEDFRKIDPSGRAGMLFQAIPAELNKNASRYQVSSVIAGEKEERVREILADINCFYVIQDYLQLLHLRIEILRRYLIYTKDVRKDKDVICLPVYMAPFL